MKVANFFYDGYTQQGFINAATRLHEELRFTFRPAMVEERSRLVEAAGQFKPDAYDRHVAAFLAQKIITWDLVDGSNRALAISSANLLRLHPELFVKLHRIVVGWIASDVDPLWSADAKDDLVEDEYLAAICGQMVGAAREERIEKN